MGWELDGVKIYDSEDMEKVIKKEKIEILIITTPAAVIPDIFSKLKKTPIKGVLNFAGKHLVSDEDIIIRNVDLALELEQLMFFLTNK